MVRTISTGLCKDFYVFPASNYFRFNFSLHFPVHETILPDCYGAANKEETRLVYFYKLQDVNQEGWQRNL